jgi:hypothetical protein
MRTLVLVLGLTVSFALGGRCGAGGRLVAAVVGPAATRLISVDGSLDFGEVPVGGRRVLTILLVNSGNAPLTVRGLDVTSGLQAHTSANWSRGTMAAGATQPIRIAFAPFAPGPYRGFVSVVGDQTSGASTVAISAQVTEAADDAPPSQLQRVMAAPRREHMVAWRWPPLLRTRPIPDVYCIHLSAASPWPSPTRPPTS